MGADQPLEIGRQRHPLQLQRQRIAMGIGDQDHPLAGLADRLQKGVGVRAQRDQVGRFQFQLAHRQLQLGTPEIQAVPVQRAGVAFEQRLHFQLGHRTADAMQLGVALGQVLQPEVVVVVQVQQGAVHIQQYGIDVVPGQEGM